MKKQLTAVLLIFALLLTMSGCSVAHAVQKLDAAEDRVEAKLDAAEDKLEASLRNNGSPAPAAASKEAVPAPTPVETQPVPENTQKLTKEQALEIALKHLGFSADQITRLRTEYEIDNGARFYRDTAIVYAVDESEAKMKLHIQFPLEDHTQNRPQNRSLFAFL